MSNAPLTYPCGTLTRHGVIQALAQQGISGPAADSIIQLTGHKRHLAREKAIAAAIGVAHPVPRHAGAREDTIALLTLLADQVGVGGHAGLTGEGTDRVPALKDIPTKQGQSGAAWDAAVSSVLNQLTGLGILRARAHWVGDGGGAKPPAGTTELVFAVWVEWPEWLSGVPESKGIVWIHVDANGIQRKPLEGIGYRHLATLAQYLCAVAAGALNARHTICIPLSGAKAWSALAMALEGQSPQEGWSVITEEGPGCLGDLEIII